jgi:hypothetical protein
MPLTDVMTRVPDTVIEIVSPDDTFARNLLHFRDYTTLGVPHIIQMDPEEYIAWRFQDDSLIKTDFHSLVLPGGRDVPFHSAAIFEQLRREIAQIENSVR